MLTVGERYKGVPNGEELYAKWLNNCPSEAALRDVEKVIGCMIENQFVRLNSGSSHCMVIEHEALKYSSTFAGYNNLVIPCKKGRKVKGIYVQRLLKAIDLIRNYNNELE